MVNASVKVNNIFDEQYEELARYRMPGRNWMFGVSLRF
jgi:outer membrane cobalamin receptor